MNLSSHLEEGEPEGGTNTAIKLGSRKLADAAMEFSKHLYGGSDGDASEKLMEKVQSKLESISNSGRI